jgi:mannosyltransferase
MEAMSLRARRAGAPWGICLLLLVAWALHWRTFGVEELGQDGALSVDLGLGSLGAMLVYTARDVHPPLFFALLHALFAIGGPGYLVAKFLPIAAAQLSLVVLYRLVRMLAGTLVAWCAVLLLLLSVPSLLLSPTVRPFTLGLFWWLLTLYLTVRSLATPGRQARRQQIVLALATTAALLSWYLQLFFVALEAL